jgi:hypothetical protein
MLETAAESVGAVSVPVKSRGREVRLADLLRAAIEVIETYSDAAMKQAQLATPSITITGPDDAMALLRAMGREPCRCPGVVPTGGVSVTCPRHGIHVCRGATQHGPGGYHGGDA